MFLGKRCYHKLTTPLSAWEGKKKFFIISWNICPALSWIWCGLCRAVLCECEGDWCCVSSFFVSPIVSTLSSCMLAVVALLYPFSWQHTFIPVLPGAMLDIVCCPTPFLVGLLSSSLPKLKELPVEEVSSLSLDSLWPSGCSFFSKLCCLLHYLDITDCSVSLSLFSLWLKPVFWTSRHFCLGW